MSARQPIDPAWWDTEQIDGVPLRHALAERDIKSVFQFLHRRGWSWGAIAQANDMGEQRVREIANGKRRMEKYDVYVRVAIGLNIPREYLGIGLSLAGSSPAHSGQLVGPDAAPPDELTATLRHALDIATPTPAAELDQPDLHHFEEHVMKAWADRRHTAHRDTNLILVAGFAGSGKTEFAKFLSSVTGWALLDKDIITAKTRRRPGHLEAQPLGRLPRLDRRHHAARASPLLRRQLAQQRRASPRRGAPSLGMGGRAMIPTVVILYGPPVSGKDTITAALTRIDARYEPFRRLKVGAGNGDGYRLATPQDLELLRTKGVVLYENERYGNTYVVDEPHLSEMLQVDRIPVIHIGQIAGVRAVPKYPARWIPVMLWCSRETTEARAKSRGSVVVARVAAWDETLDDRLHAKSEDFIGTIDTDTMSPRAGRRDDPLMGGQRNPFNIIRSGAQSSMTAAFDIVVQHSPCSSRTVTSTSPPPAATPNGQPQPGSTTSSFPAPPPAAMTSAPTSAPTSYPGISRCRRRRSRRHTALQLRNRATRQGAIDPVQAAVDPVQAALDDLPDRTSRTADLMRRAFAI